MYQRSNATGSNGLGRNIFQPMILAVAGLGFLALLSPCCCEAFSLVAHRIIRSKCLPNHLAGPTLRLNAARGDGDNGGGTFGSFFGNAFSPPASTEPSDSSSSETEGAPVRKESKSRRERRRERRLERRRQKEQSVAPTSMTAKTSSSSPSMTPASSKFDMAQRFESVKTAVLGALSGGVAVSPVSFLHSVLAGAGGLAQWEFTTDMSSLEAALFAIVYRYAVRANDDNPMLNQGVVGAFVVVRTLSNIHVSTSCSAVPLQCGAPLGYFDWNMIGQAFWGGSESAVLFGATAMAMEYAYEKKWISKF